MIITNKYYRMALVIISFTATLFFVSCRSTVKLDDNYKKLLERTKSDNSFIDTNYVSRLAVNYAIRAATYQQQGRVADAIIELQEALKLDSSASIYYALAKNYDLMYKPHLATECLLKALESDSLFTPAMELLGDIYTTQRRYSDAIVLYEQVYKINPDKSNQLRLAFLYQMSNPEKAIVLLEDYLRSSDDSFMMFELMKLYKSANKPEKVEETVQRIEKQSDIHQNVLMNLLTYYLDLPNYQKALKTLRRINDEAQEPNIENAYLLYANYLLDDSSKSSTEDIYNFLSQIEQKFYFDYRIQIRMVFLHDKLGDSEKVEKFINHVLNIADTIPEIPIQISSYYLSKKNYDKSMEILQKYRAKTPKDLLILLNISYNYTLQNKEREALLILNEAKTLDERNTDILIQIGTIYDRLAIYDSVDMTYDEALKINPDEPLVNNNYAYSLSERNVRLDEAVKMINTSLIAEPNNPYYLDTYAWIQFRLGNYNLCEEYLFKSINSGHVNAEVYEHLGELYLVKGEKQKAIEAWKKGLELEPDSKVLLEKIKKLE